MKKIILMGDRVKKIIFLSLMLVMLAACSDSKQGSGERSVWEKTSTFFAETQNNTASYNVEAAGWNLRAVEWIPAANKNIRCVFVSGTQKGGTACYPVSK